tara:strand:+ start:28429 stop:28836 length:408 start_codon:yes stop_codon:yes gene_type:complete
MDLQIINIAANTKNNKQINNYTHKSKYKNNLCGDQIEIRLIIKKNKIFDIGYQSQACIYCQASASILSKFAINKNLIKINKLINEVLEYFNQKNHFLSKETKKLKNILNKENHSRKNCILLPFKALKKALRTNYE